MTALAMLVILPASAECPNPLPKSPSADQLRECFSDIAKLRAEVAEIKRATRTISGHYNGAGLDSMSPGHGVVTSIVAGPSVRISFNSYMFRSPPVVLLTTKRGHHVYVSDVTADHVDVVTQTIEGGHANGSVVTNKDFWFQIIPPD
jgi:hypothetical protein